MKSLTTLALIIMLTMFTTLSAQDWRKGSNNWHNSNGYYMGPGMMGNYGMMWNYGMMRNYGNENLNLSDEQKSKWNQIADNGESNIKTANDSINYYVKQVQRLQQQHSNQVNTDLEQIKKILTPAQYTQFLEKIVSGTPGK